MAKCEVQHGEREAATLAPSGTHLVERVDECSASVLRVRCLAVVREAPAAQHSGERSDESCAPTGAPSCSRFSPVGPALATPARDRRGRPLALNEARFQQVDADRQRRAFRATPSVPSPCW